MYYSMLPYVYLIPKGQGIRFCWLVHECEPWHEYGEASDGITGASDILLIIHMIIKINRTDLLLSPYNVKFVSSLIMVKNNHCLWWLISFVNLIASRITRRQVFIGIRGDQVSLGSSLGRIINIRLIEVGRPALCVAAFHGLGSWTEDKGNSKQTICLLSSWLWPTASCSCPNDFLPYHCGPHPWTVSPGETPSPLRCFCLSVLCSNKKSD